MVHKFKKVNYDLSWCIVSFLDEYNKKTNKIDDLKFKITSKALNRLDKFINIYVKTILVNASIVSIERKKVNIPGHLVEQIEQIVLRGYEVNLEKIEEDYSYITNPINDLGKSRFSSDCTSRMYASRIYDSNIFTETFDTILNEIISLYGEDSLEKGEHELSFSITQILLAMIDCTKKGSCL